MSPPFALFVSLLHAISRDSRPVLLFTRWVAQLRADFAQLDDGTTATLFRFLFPEEDTRRKYDMKEAKLAQAISDCLGTSAKLRDWDTTTGCLGNQVLKVMERASSSNVESSPLSMADIDDFLDELASHSAFSDSSIRQRYPKATRRSRTMLLRLMFRSLTPLEGAYLTQIILKDLRPMLYPLSETHYTRALTAHNSSVPMLTAVDAMKIWDPTCRMLRAHRVQARLDDAAAAFEQGDLCAIKPTVGTPIPIPKALKGRGCDDALKAFCSSEQVWAETKYDGERAQIHVQLVPSGKPRITIFSKSLRDSTWDRYGVHSLILESLGLQLGLTGSAVETDIVLEAEMVAWHEDKIDEFWRICTLVQSTARGARRTDVRENDESYTHASLKTDNAGRHLGLVFFDLLVLNGGSLLDLPYWRRRETLESVVTPVSNRSLLAERRRICPDSTLEEIFSDRVVNGKEGLMLKAASGRYNDARSPWVKLKKDYIPGFGDALDLVVVGVGWEKERARELRVAPDCYTTFYIGGLHNEEEVKHDPQTKPHFYVYFTVSYGLDREELEAANFLIKCADTQPYSASAPNLPYTFSLRHGLTPPSVILMQPLLAELYGAGFTKSSGGRAYELRFPRMTKLFRLRERGWTDAVTLKELHTIAREAMGRDRSDKDVEDATWNKPSSPVAALKRKAKAAELEGRLLATANKRPRLERRQTLPATLAPPRTSCGVLPAISSPAPASLRRPRVTASAQAILVSPKREANANNEANPPTSTPNNNINASNNFGKLLDTSAVFIATRDKALRRRWQTLVPTRNLVHSLASLFQACGWVDDEPSSVLSERGIILLAVDEAAQYRAGLVAVVDNQRNASSAGRELRSIRFLEQETPTCNV
ncbi:DNA-LIGASE-A3 domain-containing protein [Mycena kentingensis (nom. inval.)]|nr:DNA-LIGASE-A3 domain-containing protein [Mycena kentingensis (nom. inval.)]